MGWHLQTHRNWIDEQQGLAEEVREFRRRGRAIRFSGLLEIAKLIDKAVLPGRHWRQRRSGCSARGGSRRRVAGNCLTSAGKHEVGVVRVRVLSERVTDFTEFLRFFPQQDPAG